jgi:hypothetical protein
MLKKFSGFVLASKILGAHGTLPAHTATQAFTNAPRLIRRGVNLAHVRKRAAPYLSPHGPRWALPVEWRVLAHRGLAGEINDFFEHPADDVEIFINS